MLLSPGAIDTAFVEQTVDPVARERRRGHSQAVGLAAEDVVRQPRTTVAAPRHLRVHEVAIVPSAQKR